MPLRSLSIPIVELARWIYQDAPQELEARVAELKQRQLEGPTIHGGWASADGLAFGAYFYTLPGGVLTLGGMRSTARAAQCVEPLSQLVHRSTAIETNQVQAVIPSKFSRQLSPILSTQFTNVTDVFHIYRDLQHTRLFDNEVAISEPVSWRPACEFTHPYVAQRIVETFDGTLDCPELNGLRSSKQTLDGFLDGEHLREKQDWYLLELGGDQIGCALLTHHPESQLLELTYMGLRPVARKRGLGKRLVELAIQRGKALNCVGVAAAVDRRNLPALKVYEAMGFLCHAEFQVWLDARRAASGRKTA